MDVCVCAPFWLPEGMHGVIVLPTQTIARDPITLSDDDWGV